MVWEIMVRVRREKNITRLDTYSRAFRPALSIKPAAKATERRRTAPTRAASYLTDTGRDWSSFINSTAKENKTWT